MTLTLRGRRVVIIGGASGIGFAVAQLALSAGAEVIIASRNAKRVETAVALLPGAHGATVDLRDEACIGALFGEVGPFAHLAITAGDWDTLPIASTSDIDLSKAKEGFEVRFWGALAAAKRASRSIVQDGSITLTSGMLGPRPQKGAPLISAMLGAVEYLTRGLAVDLAPIRVNVVCPGLILTEHVLDMPQDVRHKSVQHLPLPRTATPEEAAQAYIYFMLNSFSTGQSLAVDGGGMLV